MPCVAQLREAYAAAGGGDRLRHLQLLLAHGGQHLEHRFGLVCGAAQRGEALQHAGVQDERSAGGKIGDLRIDLRVDLLEAGRQSALPGGLRCVFFGERAWHGLDVENLLVDWEDVQLVLSLQAGTARTSRTMQVEQFDKERMKRSLKRGTTTS